MSKIDLERVKRLQYGGHPGSRKKKILLKAVAAGTINARGARAIIRGAQTPGLENTGTMFFYKNRYYYPKDGKLTKLSEAEAKTILEPDNKVKCHLLCQGRTVCPMPDPFALEDVTVKQVKDDNAAASYISEKSGLTVTVKDL